MHRTRAPRPGTDTPTTLINYGLFVIGLLSAAVLLLVLIDHLV